MSAGEPLPIRLHGLTLGYDRHPAVHHLDGTIRPGDLLALAGPNGAGKSTLLKGLIGEIPVLDGRIEAGGAIAYLPQADTIDRSFPLTVMDLAAMGLWRRLGPWRSLRRAEAGVREALATVGLSGFEARPIGTLSGGQLRRALFARLILQDCRTILLDEPFTAIDARTTEDLLGLVRRWHGEGRTVVAALHDFGQIRSHFPATLLLAREPVAWGPTAEVLSADNLARARRLSEAWDEEARPCDGSRHAAPSAAPVPPEVRPHRHAHGDGHRHDHPQGHDHPHETAA
ncbi:metal ABC transporter ATP-binding protein [Methylobacterium aerolatum]|uniref:Zinc/manganese transport system ATP-binding protein n=1 Tax=Methylobacterium aerolatum TaxID=418708 RepID=A0ABU0HXR1_9HYPH|nr:ABC transporter ATP-binding protein [Methylobacterium aerolatum]MDQ0446485.1 zinc/manganese transport system ATP-binding protein [Methylobacterium aerolatum]GJD33353.1 Vitamin B12 import ATP-binding protein BtuD [Methylobacterium aerolatum]